MSCSVECIAVIYTIPKLLAAIQALSAFAISNLDNANEEKVEIKQDKVLVDKVGNKIAVEIMIKNSYGDLIGVKSTPAINGEPQPLEFIFENPESKTAKKTLDHVRQAYARLQILNELKNKGYGNLKEEKLPNGSIRLVVQKWQ